MEYNIADIKYLLHELVRQVNLPITQATSGEITSQIVEKLDTTPFADDYIYRQIHLQARKAEREKKGIVHLREEAVEIIARFLDHESFRELLEARDTPAHSVIAGCVGTWRNYVRCNSGHPDILISPVKIFVEKRKAHMIMRGPGRTFKGEPHLKGACIYIQLEGDHEKSIHMVTRIANSIRPDMLLGVFAAASSGGDPIAGRQVLMRQANMDYESEEPAKVTVKELQDSDDLAMQALAAYLGPQSDNTLKAGPASTFTWKDLAANIK